MTPRIVIHTDLMMGTAAGKALGPIILIRPAYRGDAGLLAHEVEHVRQFWATAGLHLVLYPLVRRYRMWAEARAFARQVQHGAALADMAERMARPVYRLRITQERAAAAIAAHL